MKEAMSKLQTRLIQNLETNNRTALELVKISAWLTKEASNNAPRFACLAALSATVNRLAEKITADNAATIALLDQFP